MNVKDAINDKIDKLDENFESLVNDNKLDINSIENLAVNGVEDIKNIINNHIEELLSKKIDEKNLIIKKTRMEGKWIYSKKYRKKEN